MNTNSQEASAPAEVAQITEAQVVAWLRSKAQEIKTRFGVHKAGIDFGANVGASNYTAIYVHAGEQYASVVEDGVGLDKAMARLADLMAEPEKRAQELRDRAAKLLAEAEQLVPATT